MDQTRDASLDLLIDLAQPSPDDRALDFAAGAGMAGFTLAPEVAAVEAAGELPDLLDEGRRLAAELGLANVTLTLADLYALPYEDAAFSLIVCHDALHALPEPVAALGELQRVLAEGGRIVIVDAVVDEVTDQAFNEIARLREPAHRRHCTAAELDGIVTRAGLKTTGRGSVRRTIDLDYWLQAAAVPAAKADLIRERFKTLPVDVQAGLDAVFADRLVSFSQTVAGLRLERA